jgi:hypothetical protein
MSRTPEHLLEEAQKLWSSDPDRALELRREVAAGEISPAWSKANIDLADYEYSVGSFESAIQRVQRVLAAPVANVEAAARAVAGILLAIARTALGEDVDEALLEESTHAALVLGEAYYAGCGLSHQGRLRQYLHHDREGAKQAFERAAALFDQSASALAGPGVRLRLATLAHEDGDHEHARCQIELALARLDQFPYIGMGAHKIREKLLALRARLPGGG